MYNEPVEPICFPTSDPTDPVCGILVVVGAIIMFFEIFFSFFINSRLLYIICQTYKEESKAGYFPILFIMSIFAWPAEISFIIIVFFMMITGGKIDEDNINLGLGIAGRLAIGFFFTYPVLISFLDFILCTHRLLSIFGVNFGPLTNKFRWFGPLVFASFAPAILSIVLLSVGHKIGFTEKDYLPEFIKFDIYRIAFVMDNILKVCFTCGSVGGYLAILCKLVQVRKRVEGSVQRDDIFIIKQALPIAICQMIFVLLSFTCDIVCTWMLKVFLDCFLFLTSTIVVPVSIISGNPLKRRIYRSSRCCCQKKGISELTNFENMETELQITIGPINS